MTHTLFTALASGTALLFSAVALPGAAQTPDMVLASTWVPARNVTAAPLQRAIALKLENVRVKQALQEIGRLGRIEIAYGDDVLGSEARVSLAAEGITVRDALLAALEGTGLEAFVSLTGTKVLVRAPERQPGSIAGTVRDAATGGPLAGVTVAVVGTRLAGATGAEGRYAIPDVPPGTHQVRARLLGYLAAERAVAVGEGQQSVADFELQARPIEMDPVVSIGYATARKSDLTGAVSAVASEEFESRPITNASQALQGLATGLYINQASGQPGQDGATIRIRGLTTLPDGDNDPLVLIDGIEGPLSQVNPTDIKSIAVLKDAASAAIYGSRGASGVILVETKTGKPGENLHLEYTGYTGMQEATRLPEAVTNSVQFMEMYNQALINEGRAPLFTAEQIDEFRTGTDPLLYPNTNWLDVVFDPAAVQEHTLRVSGERGGTRYALSGGAMKQQGVMVGTKADRYRFRLNLDSDVSERLNLGVRVYGSRRVTEQSQYWHFDGTGGVFLEATRAWPIMPVKFPDGRYATSWIPAGRNQFRNPLVLATEGIVPNEDHDVTGQAFASYNLVPGLTLFGTYAVTREENFSRNFIPNVSAYDPKTGDAYPLSWVAPNSVSSSSGNTLKQTAYATLTYDRTLAGAHALKAMLGYSEETATSQWVGGGMHDVPSNDLKVIDAGTRNPSIGGSNWEWGLKSVFGRLNYGFRDKYLFQANFRHDGSSRLPPGHRWGLFPSFSAGWRLSQEHFLRNVRFLDELKVRGSWGKLGNQEIGLYPYQQIVSLGQDYVFGGEVAPGAAVTRLVNQDITWETTTTTDIGVDAVAGPLDITFDYFHKYTDGILREAAIPGAIGGLAGPTVNLAAVRNRGWELAVGFTGTRGNLSYGIRGNVTQVHNEVANLPEQVIDGPRILKQGLPIGSWYMLVADGIYQSQEEIDNSAVWQNERWRIRPGDIRYVDTNRDGVINFDDRQVVGSTTPEWTYGLTLDVGYKGFDFATLLQGVQNVQSWQTGALIVPFLEGYAGVGQRWVNAWTPENRTNELPRLTTQAYTPNFVPSTFWLEDASYLRVKNIQLGYTVPGILTRRVGVKSLRLYVNAQNPFTFTRYHGIDPERPLNNGWSNSHPNVRILTVGTTVRF
jgi:TonB-linked SusC/RagA family outer membrane protein